MSKIATSIHEHYLLQTEKGEEDWVCEGMNMPEECCYSGCTGRRAFF